jgi:hypothetical protein
MFVPPDLAARDEVLCSTGVSLFTGLCVSGTAGFAIGALSTSGSRVFADCETDRSFGPSAARAPAARISSSVSLGGADFFSRGLDLCGVGVVDSEASCSEGCGVCVERSDFFSRATITSCACIFPMRTTLKSITGKNRFSMTPPDKRFSPFTTLFHETLPISTRRTLLHVNHRQRKPQLQFVFEVNLDVMHPVLLKLHAAKIMDVGRVAFHFFELELDLCLRDYLLFVHAHEARFLVKFAGAAAPAGPNAEPKIIDR